MKRTAKPVHRCHSCLLNLGDHCWLYEYPRGQWSKRRGCRAFGNDEIYAKYREWQEKPKVKTRKQLRREFFRTTRKTEEHYNHFGDGVLRP